ncbi:MAG: ion channel [Akkermansiaceae bacterium]
MTGICEYLLPALFWSSFYQALCTLQTGAFVSSQSGAVPRNGPDLPYFSIVSLTTLGYGDMAPLPNAMACLFVH